MDGNFWQALEKFKLPIALSLIGLVLIVGGMFTSGLNKSVRQANYPKESLVSSVEISVDVSGAVVNPGVYQLKEGSRVEEAILAAAGFTENANQEYISKYLNMAQKLSDGTKVYIPFAGEPASAGLTGGSAVSGTQIQAKININTATQTELESLTGIGPSRASDIIAGRPYQKIEELLGKKIIGPTVFENIKDSIVVY